MWVCSKSTDLRKGRHSDTSFTFGITKNTNLAIGGFLAGLHQSPLTFLFAVSGFTNNLQINTPKIFSPLISEELSVGAICGKKNFQNFIFLEFYNFFHRQRAEMVRTRSRVTSPGPHESRDASSNPYCDSQSAPAMQPSFVPHMQSMVPPWQS